MKAFFVRLWNRRLLRCGAGSLITLITLYALLCAVINWTGSRRWTQTKAMLAKEGEPLDFNKLLPPPIDDAHNFCAIEPLRGITISGDEKSAPGLKRAALQSTGWQQVKGSLVVPSLLEGPALGKPADMAAWAAFARASKYAALPADSGDAARDLLAGIDASHPLLKQLAEAAEVRPEATFVPGLVPTRPLCAMLLPHYGAVHTLGPALALRSVAACEAGDHAAACQSAQAALRLAGAVKREPTLIGALVAQTIHESAEEAVWTLLKKRQATDAELKALQSSLARLDFHQAVLTAMRGEMAISIDTLEYMQAAPSRMPDLIDAMPADGLPRSPPSWLKRFLWDLLVPAGWFDHNKAVVVTMELETCIRPLRQGNAQDLLRQQAAFEEEVKTRSGLLHPDRFLANLMVPALTTIEERTFAAEALRRQALTACALERYCLEHKVYPAALTELVPAFITSIPKDPMDDQPLRYRRTSDGRYMLWSIGFDMKDDGGRVNVNPDGASTISKMHRSTYKGDWTWQYTPVK